MKRPRAKITKAVRKPLHIALVNQWYPPETGGGGVAAHNHDFAVACVGLGHRVTVIAQLPRNGGTARTVVEGVDVIRVPSPDLYRYRKIPVVGRQYRYVQAMGYSRSVCRALESLNRESPVDIAEFADVNAEGFFWREGMSKRLAIRCHTPNWVLQQYHQKSEMPFDAGLLGWAERRAIRRAHLLTAPSRDMAELVARDCGLPSGAIHAIPNALETGLQLPSRTRPRREDPVVLFVGRLERSKGVGVLVEAIPRVLSANPRVRFVIVGEPRSIGGGRTYRDFVGEKLAQFIRAGKVSVTGFLPDDELLEWYDRADIAVVPSLLYESFSITCAQAMAHGVPVVATAIGGIPETLEFGKCGVIVQPGSVEELANGILLLLKDKKLRLRMGKAGRERTIAHFSSEVVARRIVHLYEQALSV
jgi:glycogen synthase